MIPPSLPCTHTLPNSVQTWSSSANFGRFRAKTDPSWPHSSQTDSETILCSNLGQMAEFARVWATPARCQEIFGRIRAQFRRSWSIPGQCLAKSVLLAGRSCPTMARVWPNFGRTRAVWAQVWSNSLRLRPSVDDFNQIWLSLAQNGLHSKSLCQAIIQERVLINTTRC